MKSTSKHVNIDYLGSPIFTSDRVCTLNSTWLFLWQAHTPYGTWDTFPNSPYMDCMEQEDPI